jgi:hypothetical protein
MAKLIIFSVVLMSFGVPIAMASLPNPRRSLRRVQVIMLAYIVLWALMCVYWYPELVHVD